MSWFNSPFTYCLKSCSGSIFASKALIDTMINNNIAVCIIMNANLVECLPLLKENNCITSVPCRYKNITEENPDNRERHEPCRYNPGFNSGLHPRVD